MSAKGVAMKEQELRVLVSVASFPAAFLDLFFFFFWSKPFPVMLLPSPFTYFQFINCPNAK